MSIAKEEARKLIETIPDDASWDDVMYEFYVRTKIEIGLEAADAGKVVSQEEVEKRFCPERKSRGASRQ
jgi:predicted transcriptional regulator